MKKNSLVLILLSLVINTISQIWTEPVAINPLQGNLYNEYPDFTIDNSGNIHCVWSTKHGTNFYRIYYSKSTDYGETWTNPVSVSYNSEKWAGEPHIVSDSEDNLHLTYDYDVGSISNIKILYKKFEGTNWTIPDTINKGMDGCMHNRLAIDNNDRIYCFWFVLTVASGNTFYKYKNSGTNDWSEVIKAYDSAFFMQIVPDVFNNLHVVGTVEKLNYSWYKIGYYKFHDEIWDEVVEIGHQTQGNTASIAIDLNEEPRLVWQQISSSSPLSDTMFYTEYNNGLWSSPEVVIDEVNYLTMCIDDNNSSHIICTNESDTGTYLLHIENIDLNWQIDAIDTGYHGQSIIKYSNDNLYLINIVVDTIIGGSPHTRILFRKKEMQITYSNNLNSDISGFTLYPNPTWDKIDIKIVLDINQSLKAQIFNLKGKMIKSLYNGNISKENINLFWDGRNEAGNRVSDGIYLLNIITDNAIITKKIIKY
jgi:hypothetical protein